MGLFHVCYLDRYFLCDVPEDAPACSHFVYPLCSYFEFFTLFWQMLLTFIVELAFYYCILSGSFATLRNLFTFGPGLCCC